MNIRRHDKIKGSSSFWSNQKSIFSTLCIFETRASRKIATHCTLCEWFPSTFILVNSVVVFYKKTYRAQPYRIDATKIIKHLLIIYDCPRSVSTIYIYIYGG